MRALSRVLFGIGLVCIGIYGLSAVRAHVHQQELVWALGNPTLVDTSSTRLSEGDLLGKLEIPRLRLSVMIMEGVADETLRLGGGHVPGTAYPGTSGNSGVAAHRDTFFASCVT
jgi:sortase (surface protein transpeptidase)